MKPLHFLLFIVTLPVLISLGHDFYLFYVAQGEQLSPDLLTKIYTEDRPGRSFSFAALGYIWTQYGPESYKLMADSYDPQEWSKIQEFLKLKATLVFGAIAGAAFALAGLVKLVQYLKERSTQLSRRKKIRNR